MGILDAAPLRRSGECVVFVCWMSSRAARLRKKNTQCCVARSDERGAHFTKTIGLREIPAVSRYAVTGNPEAEAVAITDPRVSRDVAGAESYCH